MASVYLILGAPGSGKSTQGILLSEHLGLWHLSWGKLVRSKKFQREEPALYESIANPKTNDSERSILISRAVHLQLDQFLKRGGEGIVIDGFPRRLQEATELVDTLQHHDLRLKSLILINSSLRSVSNRIIHRTVCNNCGRKFDPSNYRPQPEKCPHDNTPLRTEALDRQVIEKDYENYLDEIIPTYNFLKKYSDCYFTVSGDDEDVIVASNILLKINDCSREGMQLYNRHSSAPLPTKYGEFQIVAYQNRIDYTYHLALVKGNPEGKRNVLARVHSSCITGDIFGSEKCDCGSQLQNSMSLIESAGEGVIFYLFQEGRGINIINKVMTYKLQEDGFDTVEANEKMGLPAEMRQYDVVKDMCFDLKIKSLRLMTNNPDKVNKLSEIGVPIEEIVPLEIKPSAYNRRYLKTKKHKMGHVLPNTN